MLRDTVVVDVAAANAQYERTHASAAKLRIPADLKEVIARYDAEFGPRLRLLAAENAAVQSAAYIRSIDAVKVLPPVRPAIMLNAGANYPEHAAGIVQENARAAGAAGARRRGRPAGCWRSAARGLAVGARHLGAAGRRCPSRQSLSVPQVAHHGGRCAR